MKKYLYITCFIIMLFNLIGINLYVQGTSTDIDMNNNTESDINASIEYDGTYKVTEVKLPKCEISDWAITSVEKAISLWIIPQNLQNKYLLYINREDFCIIAYNLLDQCGKINLKNAEEKFIDTTSEEINILTQLGIITGKSSSEFDPNSNITREEAAAIISRMADYLNISADIDSSFKYGDDDNISDWAKESVYKINAIGIMNGTSNNNFEPKLSFTKEQAIVAIMRLYDKL